MSNFGYVSPLLVPDQHPAWRRLMALVSGQIHLLPLRPKAVGAITGSLFENQVRGYAWRTPGSSATSWNDSRIAMFWELFLKEISRRAVTVVGLDRGAPLPPAQFLEYPDLPGISDGKALELLLFASGFHHTLRRFDISPAKATATIIWEEGNLGQTCARLLGRELRFLTLVHPNLKTLEQAAEVIASETGLSPRIFTAIPPDYHEVGIIIQCGRLSHPYPAIGLNQAIDYYLFRGDTALGGLPVDLEAPGIQPPGGWQLYPALGEAIFRACFALEKGIWCGPQLPLERVMKLEGVLKELDRGSDLCF